LVPGESESSNSEIKSAANGPQNKTGVFLETRKGYKDCDYISGTYRDPFHKETEQAVSSGIRRYAQQGPKSKT
jgi:hypothetical protein